MLNPTHNTNSVKHFFRKSLRAWHTVASRGINVDKNSSYTKVVGKIEKKGDLPRACELRPVKYLNNLIGHDHRFVKRRVNPGMGFGPYDTAWRTIQDYEAITNYAMDRSRRQPGRETSEMRVGRSSRIAAKIRFSPTRNPHELSLLWFHCNSLTFYQNLV